MTVPQICQEGLPSIDQLIQMLNATSDKINVAAGQLFSGMQGLANSIAINQALGQNLNLGGFVTNLFSSCPDLLGIKRCLEGLLADLDFGVDLGLSFKLQAPCFNLALQDLIDIQFQCARQTAEALIDQGVADPLQTSRLARLNDPGMIAPGGLGYTRQDDRVLLQWQAAGNPPGTIYVAEIYGIQVGATTDLQMLLPRLTMARPTPVTLKAKDPTLRFESTPATVTVVAFDSRVPFDVTGLEILGASQTEVLLRWVASTFPGVIGYNLRWREGDRERIYSMGPRVEVALSDVLPPTPTTVRVTTVTQWDESAGVEILVTPRVFAVTASVFDPVVAQPPGTPVTLTLTVNDQLAPLGNWYKGRLISAVDPDILIPHADMTLTASNELEVAFLTPPAGYTTIEVIVWSEIGESLTVVEALP